MNKFRLKCALALHFMLYTLMLAKLIEDILDRFDIDWMPLERLKVPEPHTWEYVYMLSIIPFGLAIAAIFRNREKFMRWSYVGQFCFAFLPIIFGTGSLLPQLWTYWKQRNSSSAENLEYFVGFPVVVLWFVFFAVALQVHGFEMYFTTQLVRAWRPAGAPAQKNKQDVAAAAAKPKEEHRKTK